MGQKVQIVWAGIAFSVFVMGLFLAGCKNPTTPEPLDPPIGPWPLHGSTILDTTPLFDWEDVVDAAGYHLQVNTNDSFTGTMVEDNVSVTASQYQVTIMLSDNTTYYWRVRVKDTDGMWGNWGDIWSFTIDIAPPSTPFPSDGSATNKTTPLLDWDDVLEAAAYHVQFSENDSFSGSMIEDNDAVVISQYQVSTALSEGATYYWRVRVQNGDGYWGDWSDIWDFSVDISPPVVNTAPILNIDETYTRDSDVTVSHSVSEATQMIMSENSSFSGSAWGAYQTNPIFTLSVGDGTKTVYIKYRDDAGNETGTYSDTIIYDHNVFVSCSGSDSNAGTPDSPLLTLGAGVVLAQTSTPTEVRIEGGTPELVYNLGSSGLSIPAGVSLKGGYNSTFSNCDPDTYISKITSTDSFTIMFDGQSITNTTQIDGFTITNISAFLGSAYTIYCTNSAAPKITHNTIYNEATFIESVTNQTAATAGIYCDIANPVIEYNTIEGGSGTATLEQSAGSAGIYCKNASPTIRYNVAINGGSGTATLEQSAGSAGIYCKNASPTIQYNVAINGGSGTATRGQSAGSAGIYCQNASPAIRYNTAINGGSGTANSTGISNSVGSAGICCYYSSPDISNNTEINGGTGTAGDDYQCSGSAGIYCEGSSVAISNNTMIHGGSGNYISAMTGHGAGSAGIFGISITGIITGNIEINGGSGTANGGDNAGSAGIYLSDEDTYSGGTTISNNTTIYGGSGSVSDGTDSAGSAGIYCNYASPNIVSNTEISGGSGSANSDMLSVGVGSVGIFLDSPDWDGEGSVISNNTTINGGSGTTNQRESAGSAAIYCHMSNPNIFNNATLYGGSGIANNIESSGSVAIYCNRDTDFPNSQPLIINNNTQINGGTGSAIDNQSAGSSAIYCNASSPIIKNNIIQGGDGDAYTNAFVDSAAIFSINSCSSVKIVNNVLMADATNHEIAICVFIGGTGGRIANNSVFTTGGTSRCGMYEDGSGNDPTIVRNNLVFSCPTALYYDEGTTAHTTIADVNNLAECSENITTAQSLSQLFVGGSPFDYHLTSGSDAIDTGLDTSGAYWGEVTDDIDGETRPKGSAYDIGFDEY
jgi:hypothetical protein